MWTPCEQCKGRVRQGLHLLQPALRPDTLESPRISSATARGSSTVTTLQNHGRIPVDQTDYFQVNNMWQSFFFLSTFTRLCVISTVSKMFFSLQLHPPFHNQSPSSSNPLQSLRLLLVLQIFLLCFSLADLRSRASHKSSTCKLHS